jgi:hypothetical protein
VTNRDRLGKKLAIIESSVESAATSHLEDLLAFVQAIRNRLAST